MNTARVTHLVTVLRSRHQWTSIVHARTLSRARAPCLLVCLMILTTRNWSYRSIGSRCLCVIIRQRLLDQRFHPLAKFRVYIKRAHVRRTFREGNGNNTRTRTSVRVMSRSGTGRLPGATEETDAAVSVGGRTSRLARYRLFSLTRMCRP